MIEQSESEGNSARIRLVASLVNRPFNVVMAPPSSNKGTQQTVSQTIEKFCWKIQFKLRKD